MGATSSKEEDESDSVFDTTYISWDENGNLRYGRYILYVETSILCIWLKKD